MRSGAAVRLADLRVRQGRCDGGGGAPGRQRVRRAGGRCRWPGCTAAGARPSWPPPSCAGRSGPRGRRCCTRRPWRCWPRCTPPAASLDEARGRARPAGGTRRRDAGCRTSHALAERVGRCPGRGRRGCPHSRPRSGASLRAGLPWEAARCRLAIARLLAERRCPRSRWPRHGPRSRSSANSAPRRDADEAATVLRTLGVRRPRVPAPRTSGRAHRAGARGPAACSSRGCRTSRSPTGCSSASARWSTTSGSIFAKLGVATRAEALAYAVRHGVTADAARNAESRPPPRR